MTEFTPEQITNLMTACQTSKMRDGSDSWRVELDTLAEMLRSLRDEASYENRNLVLDIKET